MEEEKGQKTGEETAHETTGGPETFFEGETLSAEDVLLVIATLALEDKITSKDVLSTMSGLGFGELVELARIHVEETHEGEDPPDDPEPDIFSLLDREEM